jgi:exonuclease VII small subunit
MQAQTTISKAELKLSFERTAKHLRDAARQLERAEAAVDRDEWSRVEDCTRTALQEWEAAHDSAELIDQGFDPALYGE